MFSIVHPHCYIQNFLNCCTDGIPQQQWSVAQTVYHSSSGLLNRWYTTTAVFCWIDGIPQQQPSVAQTVYHSSNGLLDRWYTTAVVCCTDGIPQEQWSVVLTAYNSGGLLHRRYTTTTAVCLIVHWAQQFRRFCQPRMQWCWSNSDTMLLAWRC
jgi:hypothetical protein